MPDVEISNFNINILDPVVFANPGNTALAFGTTPNRTSRDLLRTLTFNETQTDSQSTTTEHGITAGYSVTARAEASILFATVGIETTMSLEYNYTNSKTYTKEVSRSWEDSITITVPPGYETRHTFIVQTGPFNKNVALECDITGLTTCWFSHPQVPGYTFGESDYMSRILDYEGIPNISLIGSNNIARFKGVGNLVGSMALQSYIDLEERPLPGRSGQTRRYQIPVTGRSGIDIPILDPVLSRQ